MKYVILSIAALAVIFGASFLITGLIRKKLKKKPPVGVHILISIAAGLLVICAAFFVYVGIHYSADDEALAVWAESGSVRVTEIDGAYMIDGEGIDTALVFYPGAKVDSEAYLPLMKKLAENGVDCFLLKPPMRMAIFDMNAAERIIEKYDYQTWLLSGHSMGGVAASGCAANNSDAVDGVVLLASYPNVALPDDISLLSIYGSEDMVLDRDAYEKAKSNCPTNTDEVVIDGGTTRSSATTVHRAETEQPRSPAKYSRRKQSTRSLTSFKSIVCDTMKGKCMMDRMQEAAISSIGKTSV